MMESANYCEETQHTFFPALAFMLAFVRFSISSLFNALFLLFVGHDSTFMDKFSTFHVEVNHDDETITKPSLPNKNQYDGERQELLTQELVMYNEDVAHIDATFILPEKKKKKKNNNNKRKKVKTPKAESEHGVTKQQPQPTDEGDWILVASKRSANPQPKLPKEKEIKPQEQKKANIKKNNSPKSKEASQQSGKIKPSKVETTVLPPQPTPIAHSMLKRNYHQSVDAPLVKPIRQPIGPPTSGGFGFTFEYRKSRMPAVMAH